MNLSVYPEILTSIFEKAFFILRSRGLYRFIETVSDQYNGLEIFAYQKDAWIIVHPDTDRSYNTYTLAGSNSFSCDAKIDDFIGLLEQLDRVLDFRIYVCCQHINSYLNWEHSQWFLYPQKISVFYCPGCGNRLPQPYGESVYKERNRFQTILTRSGI